jgi:hypothetical protein
MSNIHTINFSAFTPPSMVEAENRDGFITYGEDNLFPDHLIDLFRSSATHGALCNSIAQMTAGAGLNIDADAGMVKVALWKLQEVVRKCALDFVIHGGFAIEVGYNDGEIKRVDHMPFEALRSGKENDAELVDYYYYSTDWADTRTAPQRLHTFNPEKAKDHPLQVLYVAPVSPGSRYYPKPDYIGCLNYIELEKNISEFHINNIKNGLAPSFMIHFVNGTPPEQEQRRIRMNIEQNAAGAHNAGKVWITYSDTPDTKPSVEPMPLSDAHNQYQFLSTECTDKIMIGHRVVSPAMFGVKTAGELGNTDELEVASRLFHYQVVAPKQQVLAGAFEKIFGAMKIYGRVSIVNNHPYLKTDEKRTEESTALHSHELEAHFVNLEDDDELAEYVEVHSAPVDYVAEQGLDEMWAFFDSKTSAKSAQDRPLIKIRYRYAGDTTVDSRKFCRTLMSLNKFYRKEDIQGAAKKAVNPGFGPGGADNYDVWLYKGGPRCHHFWERVTFLRKDDSRMSVNDAKRMLKGLTPAERKANELPVNPRRVSAHPNDMVHKGYHPDNENMPKDARAKTSGL